MTTAYLDWSLEVECPSCCQEFDLVDDIEVSEAIFNNQWNRLRGYEVVCPHCEYPFKLDKVEY